MSDNHLTGYLGRKFTLTLRRLHWRHPFRDLRRPFRVIKREGEVLGEVGRRENLRTLRGLRILRVVPGAGSGALTSCPFGKSCFLLDLRKTRSSSYNFLFFALIWGQLHAPLRQPFLPRSMRNPSQSRTSSNLTLSPWRFLTISISRLQ